MSTKFIKSSVLCAADLELYRYLVEDFLIQHFGNLRKKDFVMKREDYSKNKVGQREYLNNSKTSDLTGKRARVPVFIPKLRRKSQ